MFYSCSTMILINWIRDNSHSMANLLWECLRKLRPVSGWLILTVSAVFVIIIFPRHLNIYIVSTDSDMLLQYIN